jgi:hypothetical protein
MKERVTGGARQGSGASALVLVRPGPVSGSSSRVTVAPRRLRLSSSGLECWNGRARPVAASWGSLQGRRASLAAPVANADARQSGAVDTGDVALRSCYSRPEVCSSWPTRPFQSRSGRGTGVMHSSYATPLPPSAVGAIRRLRLASRLPGGQRLHARLNSVATCRHVWSA